MFRKSPQNFHTNCADKYQNNDNHHNSNNDNDNNNEQHNNNLARKVPHATGGRVDRCPEGPCLARVSENATSIG